MKIAVPVKKDNRLNEHFGKCEYYAVYSISKEKKITNIDVLPIPQGCGCRSDIAFILADKGVSLMLAGGMGDGAVNVLKRSGIEVFPGCSGDATELVRQYLSGKIKNEGISCKNHQHHHGHGRNDEKLPDKERHGQRNRHNYGRTIIDS